MTNQKREENDVRNQNTLRRQWEYEYEYEKHFICPDQADTDATHEKKE